MTGIDLIKKERKRQIEEEGWTALHDENNNFNELTAAAACYITSTMNKLRRRKIF